MSSGNLVEYYINGSFMMSVTYPYTPVIPCVGETVTMFGHALEVYSVKHDDESNVVQVNFNIK